MQYYDAAQITLGKGSVTITEEYIPLWVADGTSVTSTSTSAGATWVQDGSNLSTSLSNVTSVKLHTLNANWPVGAKFAFEATIWSQGGGTTAYAQLWNMTDNIAVSGTQVSTTATSATLLRSGQVTLTAGKAYGVAIWTSNASYQVNLSGAHLIAFGQ